MYQGQFEKKVLHTKNDNDEGCRHRSILRAHRLNPLIHQSIVEHSSTKIDDSSTSSNIQNLQMEATGEANIDSIQEFFLKEATIVRSHIFHNFDDESEGDCINDPWPGNESGGDRLIGITIEADPSGACAAKKGGELPKMIGDDVLTFGREGMPDKVVESEVPEEAEKSCVDGLQGLKLETKRLMEKLKVRNLKVVRN
ncbi:unnamed protein product [Lactuca saligna]|uniref:Uncharacterized protein n=1 Tax=Lactuca saligna TaxID=75948 RepID=A0AA35VE74_LACSI|nr:unnamed protein product [Lactuca saligna]